MSRNFRMTRQRQLIIDELKKSKSHPTADDIYVRMRKSLPRISLGTVYRNLDILSEMGLIRKLKGYGSQGRFDGNTDNHYHISCIKCGKVDDLPGDSVYGIKFDYEKIPNYKIIDHSIQFRGICKNCDSHS